MLRKYQRLSASDKIISILEFIKDSNILEKEFGELKIIIY
jgi:hypothetical protein